MIEVKLTRDEAEALVAGALGMPVDLDDMQAGAETVAAALDAEAERNETTTG